MLKELEELEEIVGCPEPFQMSSAFKEFPHSKQRKDREMVGKFGDEAHTFAGVCIDQGRETGEQNYKLSAFETNQLIEHLNEGWASHSCVDYGERPNFGLRRMKTNRRSFGKSTLR